MTFQKLLVRLFTIHFRRRRRRRIL